MKVLLYNLNIGSGVEYTGNIIAQWCKEIEGIEFFEHKIQDPPCLTVNSIVNIQPDVVIINDNCPRVYEGPYYYKRFFPEKKVIYLTHGLRELNRPNKSANKYHDYSNVLLYVAVRDYFDYIVSFNTLIDIEENIKGKVIQGCFPIDPTEYKITTPWNERKKMFCYLGQLNDLKFSLEFLKELKNYNISIDCYGTVHEKYTTKEYRDALKIKQINLIGQIPQDKVSTMLNEYKYFVLPHGRIREIFNISLMQAINCGTIPLVCNDRTANFDYTWIDWAQELYIPHNKEKELLTTMTSSYINNDYTYTSESSAKEIQARFDYFKFKNEFQNLLKGFIQ